MLPSKQAPRESIFTTVEHDPIFRRTQMLPLVSVRVITYNHEKFIAQCLEGILMQRVNFPFEVIVGEDCSTDRTREIVLDYGRRFPETIRVIASETNAGGMQISMRVHKACRGKYQTMCEGDDYWIDPLKLQKQVDFMEAQPEVSLCFHNAFIINETNTFGRLFADFSFTKLLDFEEACAVSIPTASIMARSEILASLPEWRRNLSYGDELIRLWCAHHGKLGCLNEIMSVYRRHAGGITSMGKAYSTKQHNERMFMYRELDKETRHEHTAIIQARIQQATGLYERERMGWFYFILHPSQFISRMKKYISLIKLEQKLWR